jgi:hypothetical protein
MKYGRKDLILISFPSLASLCDIHPLEPMVCSLTSADRDPRVCASVTCPRVLVVTGH